MPLDFPVATRVASLNDRYRLHGATAVLERALSDPEVGRIALVSSFGAESVVLLHMVSVMDRKTPVLFLNTEMLFPETLQYQRELAERLELEDIRVITPDAGMVAALDPTGLLHKTDPDACCDLRKTVPLELALGDFDAWITGRKRFQGGRRAALEFFENEGDVRIKVNPLAMWAKEDVQEYMLNNRLPRHPLVKQGYPSIGCAPCTTKVAPGEDERAGRWRGLDKDECGIHFVNGRVVRGPLAKEDGPMNVIVTDKGFAADDFTWPVTKLADLPADDPEALAVEVGPADDVTALSNRLAKIDLIRVTFPSFSDGRGFTHARRLRLMGYTGRLRAAGHVIADQYAMARRSGFDEVEISPELAARQPQEQWLRRADWTAHDYQARLRA
jgi:phosphoadenosine phosphosulfate reductase